MSKSAKYYYDAEAIKEPSVTGDFRRPYGSPGANALDARGKQGEGSDFDHGKTGEMMDTRGHKARPSKPKGSFKAKGEPLPGQLPFRAVNEIRNKRSVWTVTTKPFSGAHFAVFPPDLISPCILAGSKPGDVVLDPFFGSGTTGYVCEKVGRKWIGIELNQKDYEKISRQRTAQMGMGM
jgi:DNA modification methylase